MPGVLDPYTSTLFQIESSGNPNAVTGSNRGLGQFGPKEEAQYGINDSNRTDPNAQAAAVAAEKAQHSAVLQKSLGRDPTPGELYLTHQQGIAGGPALLTADPNTPAWQAIRPYYKSDAMAQKAITGNIPKGSPLYGMDPNQIAAGAFTGLWKDRFEGGMGSGTQPGMNAASLGSAAPAGVTLFSGASQQQPGQGAAMSNAMGQMSQQLMSAPAIPFPKPYQFAPLQMPQQQVQQLPQMQLQRPQINLAAMLAGQRGTT